MALDYVALIILVLIIALVVYGIVAVYGIPYEIAKVRNHPHREAIGAATWVSLFTLGVLWPFLWIWALLYQPDRGWGLSGDQVSASPKMSELEGRIVALEQVHRPEAS